MPPMAYRLIALLLITIPTVADAQPPGGIARIVTVRDSVFALTHVRLVDGTGRPAADDQTIVVRGGRIAAVGRGVPIPPGARVMDLTGHTVIPGLVQLHEHTYLGGLRRNGPLVAGAYLYLAAGVTTAMTAGSQMPYDELNLKRSIDAGVVPGPRLLISGPYLTGGAPRPGPFRVVSTPEEAARVVNYWADEGATWFKVLNGPAAVLRATIQAAHARGLRVNAHLCAVSFTEAAEMGIDALQHGFITNSEYVPGRQPDVCPAGNMRAQADVEVASPLVRESIRRLVAAGTPVVSTLGVYETFSPERARLDTAQLSLLDSTVRAEVEAGHAGLASSGFTVPGRLLRRMMEWERAFVAGGGLLGSGSDPWGTGFLPGFGNLRNFELLVEAGFTPETAIRIMTLNGARILGEAERIGSIEAGKAADLVVIRGDLTRTASEIRQVVTVFRDGVGYDSARLREAVRGRVGVY